MLSTPLRRRAIAAVLSLVLLGLVLPGTPAGADDEPSLAVPGAADNLARRQALAGRSWPSDAAPGSLLVTAATSAAADRLTEDEGGERLGERVVLVRVAPGDEREAAARLGANPDVVAAEPDREYQLFKTPNDVRFGDQWAHQTAAQTGVQAAWNLTTGSSTVEVAVLDTGVHGTHPDLAPNLVAQVDVSSGTVRTRPLGSDNDPCNYGHGTMVSGVIGAVGDNSIGVAGVAWDVSLVDVNLVSPSSRCGFLESAIVAGVTYATSRGVDVINLSLGRPAESCPTALQQALDDARDAGIVVVAASGNSELDLPGIPSAPASCDGVISVGAIGETLAVSGYSSANEWVDLTAPGGDTDVPGRRAILTTVPPQGYASVEGTSFASPYVAGAAALLRSVDADLSPDDIEWFLESRATDRGPSGRDPQYGWGTVDVGAAVTAAAQGTTPQSPEIDPPFPVENLPDAADRISASGTTNAITQAVAMSKATFESSLALHAVIARADDYADALAGSSLGFGIGPLLFSNPTGPLASQTAGELLRVLEPGSTVYLLGGTAALPPTIEDEVQALGYEPVRVAGTTRELTAVAVAEQVEELLQALGWTSPETAILTTARNWPDAVAAGSLGAWFGMPILVTAPDALHPAVEGFLASRSWERLYVIGGTAAISEATKTAAQAAASVGSATRLAGQDRTGTALAIAEETEEIYVESYGFLPWSMTVAAVNLRHEGGFAHVLSASAHLGQRSGAFIPVDGVDGSSIRADVQTHSCRFPVLGIVVGGTDLVSQATDDLFGDLLTGDAAACRS